MPTANAAAMSARTNIYKSLGKDDDSLILTEVPEAPEYLTEEAADYWHYYCDMLVEGNCFKKTFIVAIQNLCIVHVIRAELMAGIEKSGGVTIKDTKVGSDGIPYDIYKPNPMVDKLLTCLMNMDRLLASMGFTAYTDRMLQFDSGPNNKLAHPGPPPIVVPPPEKKKKVV